MASQRRLRRSQFVTHYQPDNVPQDTDNIVARCGARPGDVIDLGGFRLMYWTYVGRNTNVEIGNEFHLIWNMDESGSGYATIPFLFTKHFRNALWMLYDVLTDYDATGVGVYLAADDDFVVSLFGRPLPDGTALRMEFSYGEVADGIAAIYGTQEYQWATVRLRRTPIPAAEAATYRSLADCARGNWLAASGAEEGDLYELDLDDEATAATARAIAEGTFRFQMPLRWSPPQRTEAEQAELASEEPAVVVPALSMPEPINDDDYHRMKTLGEEWNKRYPGCHFRMYARRFALQSTEEGAEALVQQIHEHWQEFAGEVRVSTPVARRFSNRVRRLGSTGGDGGRVKPVEDFTLARNPTMWLGSSNDRETYLVPYEVTFKWEDYRP
jgi:hypothetical protein